MYKLVILFLLVWNVETVSAGNNYIKGVVRDEDKEPLPKAFVCIIDACSGWCTQGVYTNDRGLYKLMIPDTLINTEIILLFRWVGYKDLKQKIILKKSAKVLNVTLQQAVIELKEL